MATRAKFKIVNHTVHEHGVDLNVQAVKGKDGEDALFESCSPSGSGRIFLKDPALAAQFPPGSHIYFDLVADGDEPPVPQDQDRGLPTLPAVAFWRVAHRNEIDWGGAQQPVEYCLTQIGEPQAAKMQGREKDEAAIATFGEWGGSEIKLTVTNPVANAYVKARTVYRVVITAAPAA